MEYLSLSGIGLKNLTNFPKIESLKHLDIRRNVLSGEGLSELLELFPNLTKLKLGENASIGIQHLDFIKNSKIEVLELQSTKASEDSNEYRDRIFELNDNLQVIDKRDRENLECDSSYEEDKDYNGESHELDDEEEEEEEEDEDDFEAGVVVEEKESDTHEEEANKLITEPKTKSHKTYEDEYEAIEDEELAEINEEARLASNNEMK